MFFLILKTKFFVILIRRHTKGNQMSDQQSLMKSNLNLKAKLN